MPIFSIPTKTGIGTLGKPAYDFIDFLHESGQAYWQILPIHPPAKEDSPYLSFSASAGNPYFIDIDWLVGDGWLSNSEVKEAGITPAPLDTQGAKEHNSPFPSYKIDYAQVAESRKKLFATLFKNFFKNPASDFEDFCKEQGIWLNSYALFMSIKNSLDGAELSDWPDKYKFRNKEALEQFKQDHVDDIKYQKMLQYFFYTQWKSLQKYAHKKGIQIIGDIPLYVSLDSADAWADPKIFEIAEDYSLSTLSGCPPNKSNDKNSTGQVWDSPVYNWDYLKNTNYKWWMGRLSAALSLYDIVRIDHFKGFESYYCIDAKTRDALNGVWKKGPGMDFWNAVEDQLNLDTMPFFAEDLGIITPPLEQLLSDCGFPGMNVLQYAFNDTKHLDKYLPENKEISKARYLPHNYKENSIAYAGTHDTNTLFGWLKNVRTDVLENAETYYQEQDTNALFNKMIRSIMNSKSNTCILTVQDLLKLGADARINTPGTIKINWMWQMTFEEFESLNAKRLLDMTQESGRHVQ